MNARDVFEVVSKPRRGCLFVIAGPSGAGKSTICRALVEGDRRLRFSISYTTRAPRGKESDGREYHFVSRESFQAMVARGEFLEHAVVHGQLYGTARPDTELELAAGNDVLLDIDVQGAEQLKAAHAGAVTVFILPPSLEVLKQRLVARGQNKDSDIDARIRTAEEEVARALEFDFIVVNDCLGEAVGGLENIIRAERYRSPQKGTP